MLGIYFKYDRKLLTNGLFRPNGTFHCLPKRDLKKLEEIFRSKVLAMLKTEGRTTDVLIEKLKEQCALKSAGYSLFLALHNQDNAQDD